jgi:hypothetical protein
MSPLVRPGELHLVLPAEVVPGVEVGVEVGRRVLPFLGVLLLLQVLPFLGVLLLLRVLPFLGVLLLPVVVLRVVRDFRHLRWVVPPEVELMVRVLPKVVRLRLVVGRFRLGGFLRPTVGFRGLGLLLQVGGRCFRFLGIPCFLGDLPVVEILLCSGVLRFLKVLPRSQRFRFLGDSHFRWVLLRWWLSQFWGGFRVPGVLRFLGGLRMPGVLRFLGGSCMPGVLRFLGSSRILGFLRFLGGSCIPVLGVLRFLGGSRILGVLRSVRILLGESIGASGV